MPTVGSGDRRSVGRMVSLYSAWHEGGRERRRKGRARGRCRPSSSFHCLARARARRKHTQAAGAAASFPLSLSALPLSFPLPPTSALPVSAAAAASSSSSFLPLKAHSLLTRSGPQLSPCLQRSRKSLHVVMAVGELDIKVGNFQISPVKLFH